MKATLNVIRSDDETLLAEEVQEGEYIVSGLDRARVRFVRENEPKAAISRWTLFPHESRFVPRSKKDDLLVLATAMVRRMNSQDDSMILIDLKSFLDRMATTVSQTPTIEEAASKTEGAPSMIESVFEKMYPDE